MNSTVLRGSPFLNVFLGPASAARTVLPSTVTGYTFPPDTSSSWASGSSVKKAKVPYVPQRSGVPMPERTRPLEPTGGKFAGIRRIVVGTPSSCRASQKALPLRKSSTLAPESGMTQFPNVMVLLGGSVLLVERNGSFVSGSRWIKSKIPWPPGFIPVMKFDQATGLKGGTLVASRRYPPRSLRDRRCGNRPSAIMCSSNCGSSASMPRTSICFGRVAAEEDPATDTQRVSTIPTTTAVTLLWPATADPLPNLVNHLLRMLTSHLVTRDKRFPVHVGRDVETEQVQGRGGNVHDMRIFPRNGSVAKEDPRD